MSFADFEQAIKSPVLRQFARHWKESCGSNRMPGWSDLKPACIARQLPIIWSYRYDSERDSLIGRLAGDRIEKIFGRTFRGTPLEALYPPDHYPIVFHRFRRVVREPALYVEEGKVFQLVDHYGLGERIALPLAADGEHGDGVVGATVYEVFRNGGSQQLQDSEAWFSF